MDSQFVIATLAHARARARTFHDTEHADDCAKSIEYVKAMTAELNGRQWAKPRDEPEQESAQEAE